MKKTLFLRLALGFGLTVTVFLASCIEEAQPPLPIEGDYLPVNKQPQYFLREQLSLDLTNIFFNDTIRIGSSGDTLIDNKRYQTFDYYSRDPLSGKIWEFHDLYKIFRQEGSQYLEPRLYASGREHVFLDTQKPQGSSWFYYDGSENDVKTIYTIRATNSSQVVNGSKLENVIDVEIETLGKNLSGGYYRVNLTHRYFAKDIGEIFVLSQWFSYTGASRLSLL
jgi:hypothetical protein